MRALTHLIAIALLSLIAACSSGPSDADVKEVVTRSSAQVDFGGVTLSDLAELEVKVLNKADQGNGRWLVETEGHMVFKKSVSDLDPVMGVALTARFGEFKKGQATPPVRDQFTMTKGSDGWIATK